MKNWAGNLEYRAAAVHYPRSVDEVCELVRRSDNVRALGTRHCFNAIADCPAGNLISLKNIDRVIRFDGPNTAERTVTVQGGITYGQLCPLVDREGFALHNLASLPHISVAGAIATATHGSGVRNGNLATAVVGMKIVNANGEEKAYSAKTHGDDFAGMVVGLGALGVVTELTLKLQPRYDMRQRVYLDLPMEQLRAHFGAIMSSAYSVSLFTDWTEPKINQVWAKHRVDEGLAAFQEGDFFGATLAMRKMHPLANMSAENCTEQLGIRGPWHERLPHFRLEFTPSTGEELQSEFFVPRERAIEAIDTVYAMRKEISPILFVSEIRAIAADHLWMSPCFKQPSVGIHFTWQQNIAAVESLLPVIQDRLRPFNARPHWGKLFSIVGLDIADLYSGRLERFRSLVHEHDPSGKFRNDFLNSTIFS
jgi:alditol oxidase